MKKFLIFVLSLIVSLSSMSLVACNNQEHLEHDYNALKFDTEAHWYECSCGQKAEKEQHYGGTTTETQKAVCEVCEQEYGDVLSPTHAHSFSVLKWDADNHWYECSCFVKDGLEAHKGGTATETQKAVCEVCNQSYGSLLSPSHSHNFNKQVILDTYKKSSANCKSPAVYYYSCDCGTKGSETFTSGNIGTHEYNNGKCIHCHQDEEPKEVGPLSKKEWQTILMAPVTNGKFVMGPIENPGEYTIYEVAGNVVRQRVYDNNTLTLELYYEFDGTNYYLYQIHPEFGNWIKLKDEDGSQAQAYMTILYFFSYGRTFYTCYDLFIYDETSACYMASNLKVSSNTYELVKIAFENGALKEIKITDNDDDKSQGNKGFSIELSNFGTTSLELPEAELFETP